MSRINIEDNRIKRYLLFGLGFSFMVLGIIGFIIPLMPGTIFLILASIFFARSSEKFHNLILHNRFVGKYIHYYHSGGKMPLRAKIITVGIIVVSLTISAAFTFWIN
ncbi:MAG: YbaN family protein [Bacteroidetes bacterium]|nr:YbaN family protein [Bacteroidota bacterium]